MTRLSKPEVQRRQRTRSGILTPEEVARIKWLLLNGYSVRQVKDMYNMSLWAIRAIDRGDTWDWVQPDAGPGSLDESMVSASLAKLDKHLNEEDLAKAAQASEDSFFANPTILERLQSEISEKIEEGEKVGSGLADLETKGDSTDEHQKHA